MAAYNSNYKKLAVQWLIETLWTFVTSVLLKTSRSLNPNFWCPRNVMGKVKRHGTNKLTIKTINLNN